MILIQTLKMSTGMKSSLLARAYEPWSLYLLSPAARFVYRSEPQNMPTSLLSFY